MAINLGSLAVDAIFLGASEALKAYLGDTLVWDNSGFVDDPKVDPDHPLVTDTTTMVRLVDGALMGMTGTATTITDGAMASTSGGTQAFAREPLPATTPTTLRITGLVKVDKTASRKSTFGFSSVATALINSISAEIGHKSGTGIAIDFPNFGGNGIAHTIIPEASCVDGAWYRCTLTWDNALTMGSSSKARVSGNAERVDGTPLPLTVHPATTPNAWMSPTNFPRALVARTTSALGTVKDVTYVDKMLGYAEDNGPVLTQPYMGTGSDNTDRAVIYSKGKCAPLRVIIASGGSGVYGGINDFGTGAGRNGHPYDAFRKMWRDLAELGYTVVHANALHEGWGNDAHLAKQLECLTQLQNQFESDTRLYYLGYSLGGSSLWRAVMGRNGFPPIRAAYGLAPISNIDMFWGHTSFPQCAIKWPTRAIIDDPYEFDAAELVARNTRVRLITSTGDINVPKATHHDPMVAKFAAAPELLSEKVFTGIGHFDAAYWDAEDCVAFFEGADLD